MSHQADSVNYRQVHLLLATNSELKQLLNIPKAILISDILPLRAHFEVIHAPKDSGCMQIGFYSGGTSSWYLSHPP